MALHQIIVYGNYKEDPEPEDFIIKDYIFDYPELLTKDRIIEMVMRATDKMFKITDIKLLRE